MKSFKKKLAIFSAMLAFLTVSSSAVYAFSRNDVVGQTSNIKIGDEIDNKVNINLLGDKSGDVAQFDAIRFDVPKTQTVNFGFSATSQTIIGRVLGGKESQILGKLTNSCTVGSCESNVLSSKVILINPAGIMFGQGSQVDLNSFTASTHDINNIKNIQSLVQKYGQEYVDGTYQKDVLNKFSPLSSVNGTDVERGSITFDSNYTDNFKNIDYTKGATKIKLDGTTFAHFIKDENGNITNKIDNVNPNKTVNIISDNIDYKNSLIRTGGNYNYITKTGENLDTDWRSSNSNVSLITADGVTFGYVANGYAEGSHKIAADKKTNAVRKIEMDNSGLADGTPAIQSGSVVVKNISKANGSNIKIKDTAIKGTKLLLGEEGGMVISAAEGKNGEYGNVTIDGSHDVLVEHSRLESVNTSAKNVNNVTKDTTAQAGGEIYIKAGGNATVKNSLLKSAPLDEANYKNTKYGDTSGMVRVTAGDTADIEGSRLIVNADSEIVAGKNIKVDNSLINAKNSITGKDKDVILYSQNGGNIDIHNGVIKGSNILAYTLDENGAMTGNINVSSDSDSTNYTSDAVVNGQNKSLLQASKKISLQGKNTKIDNSSLTYKEVKFYNDGFSGQNNVTVANNSTFSPIVTDATTGKNTISRDITLETNGNFTLDKATIQAASTKITVNGDEGKIDSIPYQISVKAGKANNISVTSTEKDVIVKNDSNINANKDINLTSKKGSVNIDKSVVNAGQDANITAYNTIAFGKGQNITNTADIDGGRNVNITSTNGDITAEKTDMAEIGYGDKLTFNAKKNNIFTSKDSLKSVNVNYIAGESNRFYTEGDVQFVNSSLKAPDNFVESGHDVIMNNLVINPATDDAKDTKTQIFANGNVTTDNVTGEDLTAKGGVFPQSVKTTRTGTERTVLDINKTKLTVETQTIKDSDNPDNGSITLDVKNADNKKAGLELTARNVDKLDKDSTDGFFKKGYYKSSTKYDAKPDESEWDKNVAPKEGPEIRLNANDNKVAIKKLFSDKLTLDKNDTKLADTTDGTPKITVKDQGGFNLDPTLDYQTTTPNDPFSYEENYNSKDKEVTPGELKFGEWSKWEKTGVSHTDPDGTLHEEIQRKRDGEITKGKITQIDQEHKIKFDNDGNPSEFTLVYDKKSTEEIPGKKFTADEFKNNPSIIPPEIKTPEGKVPEVKDFIETDEDVTHCNPAPTVDSSTDSYIGRIRIPREQVETSKTSKISDNTVDQSSNVMAAAAKVDLSEDSDSYDLDDEWDN